MEYALTPSQQDFYSKSFAHDMCLWNQGVVVGFHKHYRYDQLNAALNSLFDTFDGLRLRIAERDHKAVSHIAEFSPVQFPLFSFSSWEQLLEAAKAFVNTPITYPGPLYRCAIFHAPDQSGFLISAHHILIDGYSTQVMATFLENYLKANAPLAQPFQSYDDYVAQTNRYLESKRFMRDVQYWQDQLSQDLVFNIFSEGTSLPDYTSSEWETTIPPEMFQKIEHFCKTQGISVSAFFCTALGAYIHRESGHSAFAIGVPVLNRTTCAELNTIGLYMHILPLAIKLTSKSFLENAQATEYAKMDLFRHQKMTQSQILSSLREERKAETALFDVVFDYQNFPESDHYEMHFHYSNALSVPLEIHLHSLRKDLHRVQLRYRECIFSQEQVCALWNRVMHIVEYVLTHPDAPLFQVPQYTITEQERNTLLVQMNNTAFSYAVPDGATVASLFEHTAQTHTDKICIQLADTAISYGHFLRYVQALDQQIRIMTAAQKGIIAIIAERSLEMYLAIYATVRGGNAYLPISPEDPPERIDYILRDSNAAVILVQDKFLSCVEGKPCVNLTAFIEGSPTVDSISPVAALPEDTAYVIYTSGSTGHPKGVRISHSSLLNRILWMQAAYPLTESSVILQKTPYTFDVSLWEMFWWGICGASLAVSLPQEHFLPGKIMEAIHRFQITHLHFVPSVLDLFLTYLERSEYCYTSTCPLMHVFSSGEALRADLVHRFYRLFPYSCVRLHNLYGPTECTVDVSYYDCSPTDTDPIPIGRPIYNTQLYILDSALEPVPKGVRGQLCIAGQNVGQGYLNRPQLTSEKFILNPFGEGNMYLTGDLAQINVDDQILFCGRMDGQIKLNGQRIEVGEIATVIQSIANVTHAEVLVYEHNRQMFLAAIYCGKQAHEETIREYCAKQLPSHMVPTVFVAVPAMPITKNGKIDKKALMACVTSHTITRHYEAPITDTEAVIADIFSNVLHISPIGRNDNFFSLGGSSLSMIHALSEDALQEIPAALFIENPTPAKLAQIIEKRADHLHTWVHRLHSGMSTGKLLLLFPYAGGSAEAYAKFTNAAIQHLPDYSLYCVDYPHSDADCIQIVAELEGLLKNAEVVVYSHCAGAAPALQIIRMLEDKNIFSIKHYIAGASIPPSIPQTENIWNTVQDDMLQSILTQAGASFDTLSAQHTAEMLRRFRLDTDFWTHFFARKPETIACPITLILSKQDIFTENHSDAVSLWQPYSATIPALHYIDTPSHYFQAAAAYELIKILSDIIDQSAT